MRSGRIDKNCPESISMEKFAIYEFGQRQVENLPHGNQGQRLCLFARRLLSSAVSRNLFSAFPHVLPAKVELS